jgi:hypothetical protein
LKYLHQIRLVSNDASLERRKSGEALNVFANLPLINPLHITVFFLGIPDNKVWPNQI